jgi:O-antigen ligase
VAEDTFGSIRYFTIGAYLSLTSVVLAAFVGRYGPYVLERMMVGLYIATVTTFIAAVLVKVEVLPIEDIVYEFGGTRLRGFFKDPNVLGPALIPVFVYALYNTWYRFSAKHFVVFLAAFALILATVSRGAILTALGALGLFSLIMIYRDGFLRSINKIIWMLLAVFFSLVAGTLYLLITGQLDLLLQRTELQHYDIHRFLVQELLISEISKNPFGVGPGETNFHVRAYNLEGSVASHNIYLRVAFESGWVGFLVFALIMIFTAIVGCLQVMRTRVNMPYMAILLPSFVATMVSGFTIDTLHWRHLWLIMAFIWGYEAFYQFKER